MTILAIRPQTTDASSVRCTPNVLPCKIHHEGPVNASARYWAPTKNNDEHLEAYFRGRQLHGKELKLPEGYRGVVLQKSSSTISLERTSANRASNDGDQEEAGSEQEPVNILEEKAAFDKIVAWDHEAAPDARNDSYVKGVEEWIEFAGLMHSYASESKKRE